MRRREPTAILATTMAATDPRTAPSLTIALEQATAGLWAIAALGRLAESGTLARLTEGPELIEDPVELADARLLVACGMLDAGIDGYAVSGAPAGFADTAGALARTQLLQAIAHTRGQPPGWQTGDGAVLLAQGRASAGLAEVIEAHLLPRMPEADAVFSAGCARFLDVGVGVAALTIALTERFPGTRTVGLDVLPAALDIACTQIAVAGMRGAIELRLQSIAELSDEKTFDLAWVPQMFIGPDPLDAGLARVRAALRPGAWVILALAGERDESPVDAYHALIATALGGGPMGTAEGTALLARHGYVNAVVADTPLSEPVLLAQRPR
jgi:SAM-dependent methyltransferase